MNPLHSMAGALSPGATKMIRLDHAHATTLFHGIADEKSEGARDAAIRALCTALEIHARLEEELFYPALRDHGVGGPGAAADASSGRSGGRGDDPLADEAGAMLAKSEPEHAEMKQLIATLRALDGQGRREEQDRALHTLLRAVLHHVADEEAVLLPAAERALGERRLGELGQAMTKRRLELAGPRAGEIARDMARAAPVKTSLVALGAVLSVAALVGGLAMRGSHRAGGHAGLKRRPLSRSAWS